MAGKSKFQISRSLDDKIKKCISSASECDTDFAKYSHAFILGFNYSNVTNYVGLTTNYQLHSSGFPVVGLSYFNASPSNDEIKSTLEPVRQYFASPEGIGSHAKTDKNEHLFLVYYVDDETKQAIKRVFDSIAGEFLSEQPKLSVLDDSKIYNHSVLIKLTTSIKLKICQSDNMLESSSNIQSAIDEAKKLLSSDTKDISFHLNKSNFSNKSPLDSKNSLESLYAHLDPPSDVEQMGDYLPQMTKKDKEKLVEKWHNKVKDQRAPLEIQLEHNILSDSSSDTLPAELYKLNVEEFIYLHVNDSISKSTMIILFLMRQKLDLLRLALSNCPGTRIEPDELKSCNFKPIKLNHFVQAIYPLKSEGPNYEHLAQLRRELHEAYLVSLDRPAFRYSQRVLNTSLINADEKAGYLCNLHVDILDKSGTKGGERNIVEGTYTYHHYLQDRAQDSGWGCAYRSLQTIISWFKHQGYIYSQDVELRAPKSANEDKTSLLRKKLSIEARVPTHEEIQTVLVDVGDKQSSFIGSEKWIGSQEVCYVLNHLFNLDSKFISVSSGSELTYKARDLGQHFATQSTPVMIGGGVLAHTIIGVDFNPKNGDISYLVLDPHYTGPEDPTTITKKGWCGWKKNAFWDKNAFYNLCLPQRPIEF